MIINPMFFYMMYLVNTLGGAMVGSGIVSIAAAITMFFMANDSLFSKETEQNLYKWARRMIPIGIILLFIGLLIPDKETLLLMQAAKLATTDNVNAVFEALKAAMDYAVTILQ